MCGIGCARSPHGGHDPAVKGPPDAASHALVLAGRGRHAVGPRRSAGMPAACHHRPNGQCQPNAGSADQRYLNRVHATVSGVRPIRHEVQNGAREALMSQSPRSQLPAALSRRPNTGFGVPIARWLANTIGGRGDRQWKADGAGHRAHFWATIVMADAMLCA